MRVGFRGLLLAGAGNYRSMFALLALICFVIAQFQGEIIGINMLLLGLTFVAAALMWPVALPWRRSP